jgi:hypothetical protein
MGETYTMTLDYEVYSDYGIIAQCNMFEDAEYIAKKHDARAIRSTRTGDMYYRTVETIITYPKTRREK